MAPRNKRWNNISAVKGHKCFAKYEMVDHPGYVIRHCGHPTALWPYYGTTPGGETILAPNGRGFGHLADAQAAMEKLADAEAARRKVASTLSAGKGAKK
jgi:hypothetical protein